MGRNARAGSSPAPSTKQILKVLFINALSFFILQISQRLDSNLKKGHFYDLFSLILVIVKKKDYFWYR